MRFACSLNVALAAPTVGENGEDPPGFERCQKVEVCFSGTRQTGIKNSSHWPGQADERESLCKHAPLFAQ